MLFLLVLSCTDDPAPDSVASDDSVSDDTSAPEATVHHILIEPAGALLTAAGESAELTATAYDAEGNPMDVELSWFTEDPDVEVADGLVTALSDVGSAQVFATAEGVTSPGAFILLADPVEGAVLVPDAAVTDGFQVDDPADWALGWRYGITVSGMDPPEVGEVVLSSGELPIMGRFVSAQGEAWTLELIGPDEAFDDFDIQESMSLANVQPVLDPELQGSHEVIVDQDGTIRVVPLEGGERDFGPYQCEVNFSGGSISLGNMQTSLTHDLSFEFDWSLADGFQRMLVLGELELKGEVTATASSAIEGTMSCKADVIKIPVPVAGPISAVARPQVELGDGLDFSGKLQVLDMGVKLEAKAGGAFKAGLDCSSGDCDWVADFNPTAEARFTTNSMNLAEDFRFEASIQKYNYAALQLAIWAGPIELYSLTLEETKAGIKEEWKLSPNIVQAQNGGFASSEQLAPYVEFGIPLFAEAQQTLNNITGILKITLPTFTWTYTPITLARSPRGDPSVAKPFLRSQREGLAAGTSRVAEGTWP